MYITNTPSSIMMTWKVIKSFLEENTVQKIVFNKEGVNTINSLFPKKIDEMFTHINRTQIETKYGGDAPNKGDSLLPYWYCISYTTARPPAEMSSDTITEKDPTTLITVAEYRQLA